MATGKQRCQIIFLLGVFALQTGQSLAADAAAATLANEPNNTIQINAERTSVSYQATPKTENNGTVYVIEQSEYNDGSKLKRNIAAWSTTTQYPIEVLLLEDYQLPPRTAPERDAHDRSLLNPFVIRPTTTLAYLNQMTDAEYVESLNAECFEDELTAVAKIRADHIQHRAVHNEVAAQSGNGKSPYFALGYVVCVKSDEKSETPAAPAKD